MQDERIRGTRIFAEEIRLETLKLFAERGFGHVGGAMSIVEMTAVLYGGAMNIDPKNPAMYDRDRLVVSKGHAGPAVYAALALKGYFPMDWLLTLNKPGTNLPSHCDMNRTPGIDMTTGSLGQGVSTAVGIAIAQKLDGNGARTFLCVGDGECDEGQVWEGFMLAAHKKLDNLIIFCDENGQQLDGYTKNVLDTRELAAKFCAFGLHTQVVDGHDVGEIWAAVDAAKAHTGSPSMIVMRTEKGHGVGFVAGKEMNHHVAFTAEVVGEAVEHARELLEQAKAGGVTK